jgi:hypothetical protein
MGDKMNGSLVFKDCLISSLFNMAGTEQLEFHGCEFAPGVLSISPNNLVIDNCKLCNPQGTQPSELIGFDATNSQYSVSVSNSTFISEDRSIIGSGREYSFTVASLVDTSNVVVTGFPVNVTDRLKPGYAIYTKASGSSSSAVKVGRVIDVYESGGNSVVKAKFNQAPAGSDVFYFRAVQIVDIDSTNKFIGNQGQPYSLQYNHVRGVEASRIGNADVNIQRTSINFASYTFQQYLKIEGILLRLIVSVVKPFTGTTTGSSPSVATLQINHFTNGVGGSTIASVRSSTVGTRIVDLTASYNSQSGDGLPVGGTAGVAASELQLLLVDSNAAPLADVGGDVQKAPHLVIVAEYIPFKI